MPKELAKNYNPKESEEKIYEMWETKGCFKPSGDSKTEP